MKNSNDTIRDWTRNLPACSSVPQPTAPLRAPGGSSIIYIYTQTIHRTTHNLTYLIWLLFFTADLSQTLHKNCCIFLPISTAASAMPRFRSLVTSLPQWGSRYNYRPAHVGFVVGKLTQALTSLQAIKFSPTSIIPPSLHTQSLIYHTCYTSLETDSIIYSSYSRYSNLQVLQQSSGCSVNPQPQSSFL